MSQEEIDQQADDAAFLAGFDAVRPSDDFQSPEGKERGEEAGAGESAGKQSAAEEPAEGDDRQTGEEQGGAQQETEEAVLAGLTASQIKALLERSARVDSLEDQLRKVHGKFGEINGTIQELRSQHKQAPTQAEAPAPATSLGSAELDELATDYPELAALADARARQVAEAILAERTKQATETEKPAPQSDAQVDGSAVAADIDRQIQLGLMDALHEGWRDVVQSQDFTIWLAAQPDDVQRTYRDTQAAKTLSGVLNSFKDWQKATNARSAKSRRRLEDGLTPDGASSRVAHAPSADDEFAAGFYAVRPQPR